MVRVETTCSRIQSKLNGIICGKNQNRRIAYLQLNKVTDPKPVLEKV